MAKLRFYFACTLLIIGTWMLPQRSWAQLQVTPSGNATQLVNQLIGPGIVVSNATINTQPDAAGTFVSNGSNIGLPAGVLLTSGWAVNAVGPNVNQGITQAHSSPGDPQLDLLTAPFLTEDACVLEFDMMAICDTIQISYVFGSDEYDEWVCSDYTDAFAFFISGPGIVGSQNIATIPNSSTPVSINTVNIGAVGVNASFPYPANCNTGNAAYFTTNNSGTTVEYDGFTVPLIAKSAVIPCSTYHVKLVIADAGDPSLDSGVFLEQYGIRCSSTAIEVISSINSPGYNNAIEGCVSGKFTFHRMGDTTLAQTVNYTIGGTALPGFDYPILPGSITFPPMASRVAVNVTAAADGLAEAPESVQLILTDSVCSVVFSDTATLYIIDQINLDAGPIHTVCQGSAVQLGLPPQVGVAYTWNPAGNLNNPNISNPNFQTNTPGLYHLSMLGVDTSGCQGGDTTTVRVLQSPTATFTVTPGICLGEIATVTFTGTAPQGAVFNWNFAGATILSGSGQGPYHLQWNGPGTYNLSLNVQASICSATPVVQTIVVHPRPSIHLNATNPSCFGSLDGAIAAQVLSGSPAFNYSWSNGFSSATITQLGAGSYALTVVDAFGCRDTASVVLSEPSQLTNQLAVTQPICHGVAGMLAATAAGGTPAYTYNWSNGASGATITPGGGTYVLTVTDAQGCTVVQSAVVVDPPQIGLQILGDNVVCSYGEVVLTAALNGGVQPYHYQWSSLPGGVNDTNAVLHYNALMDRTYTLTMVDALGCTSEASYLVASSPRPGVDFRPDIEQACDGATITWINFTNPINSSYVWTFPDGSTSTALNPSVYMGNGDWGATLTATSPEGCVNSYTSPAMVHILPTPIASFATQPDITLIDYLLLSQAQVIFANTSPFYATSVDWSFGNGDHAFTGQVNYTFDSAGTYVITMTAYNAYGCYDDTSQTLLILPDPTLWVPTGFTPNGDGVNDLFLVTGLEVKTFDIEVYDRWGKLIFKTNDISQGWDGTVGGAIAPEGVYVFKIVGTNNTGDIRRSGSVTLVR